MYCVIGNTSYGGDANDDPSYPFKSLKLESMI